MRAALLPLVLLALGRAAGADKWDEPFVVRDEEHNFEIRTPADCVNWDAIDPDPAKPQVRALFRSVFADTEPLSYADVYVMVTPTPKGYAKMPLEKVAEKWEGSMLAHLQNPRDRKTSAGKLGQGDKTVDCYTIDVQGDYLAGIHQVTWTLALNGKFIYSLYVMRAYQAVGDEEMEAEIAEIRKSFQFLRVEAPKEEKGAKKDAPVAPGAGNAPESKEEQIDPELVKEEQISQPFWRFECVKPEGLLNIPVDQHTDAEKKNDMKLKFQREKTGTRCVIRVYAQTDKARRYTVQQLTDSKIKFFKQTYEGKQFKEPVIDPKYEFPLADQAVRIELVGRRLTTEYTFWYISDCKNERQYQIEIYMTGGDALNIWKGTVDRFIAGFKPLKK
jgi:hypothetical protein